jgi:hypothetical protein
MCVRFVPGRKRDVRPICTGEEVRCASVLYWRRGLGGGEEGAHLIRVDALDEVVGAVERVLPAARRDLSTGQVTLQNKRHLTKCAC